VNLLKLATRSLRYHRRDLSPVAGGIAVTAMVLVGALVIGDSVKATLAGITRTRLGDTQFVILTREPDIFQRICRVWIILSDKIHGVRYFFSIEHYVKHLYFSV